MAKQVLRDGNGSCLGTLTDEGNNTVRLRDGNGGNLGTYDKNNDTTRDGNGGFVGHGNLLTSLIKK